MHSVLRNSVALGTHLYDCAYQCQNSSHENLIKTDWTAQPDSCSQYHVGFAALSGILLLLVLLQRLLSVLSPSIRQVLPPIVMPVLLSPLSVIKTWNLGSIKNNQRPLLPSMRCGSHPTGQVSSRAQAVGPVAYR